MDLRRFTVLLAALAVGAAVVGGRAASQGGVTVASGSVRLPSPNLAAAGTGPDSRTLLLDGFFYETAQGRVTIPTTPTVPSPPRGLSQATVELNGAAMPDGRRVKIDMTSDGSQFTLYFHADRDTDIIRWGFAVQATPDEAYTGIM